MSGCSNGGLNVNGNTYLINTVDVLLFAVQYFNYDIELQTSLR